MPAAIVLPGVLWLGFPVGGASAVVPRRAEAFYLAAACGAAPPRSQFTLPPDIVWRWGEGACAGAGRSGAPGCMRSLPTPSTGHCRTRQVMKTTLHANLRSTTWGWYTSEIHFDCTQAVPVSSFVWSPEPAVVPDSELSE